MSLPVKLVFRAYWPSVKKFRWLAFAMVGLMVLTVLNKAASPFLFRELINALSADSMDSVILVVCAFIALHISTQIIWYSYDLAIAFFELRAMRDLQQRCFAVVQMQSMRFFENSFSGSLVTAARRFYSNFEGITDAFAYQLGRAFFMMIFTLAVFAWEFPWLALVFAIWIVVFCSISIGIATLRLKRDLVAAEKDSKVGGALADSFTHEATVKAFAMESSEQQRFDGVVEDSYQHLKKAWMFGIGLIRVQGVASWLFEIALVSMLIWGWRQGSVTVGDFIFFQTYGLILIEQMWQIGQVSHKVMKNVADAKEMAQMFAEVPEVSDAPFAKPLVVKDGKIEFRGVNFSYNVDRETHHQHDVHDFSLQIYARKIYAVVGHSGAGKSTLVKLLLRFFNVNSGCILIDGQDISSVTQVSLRQQIAVVLQEPELFHRRLRDNIACARPDASDEEIIAAAKRAYAWEFIDRLPDKLNTLVGERGVKLSGGERQRIALARAFLADAPILILDEATSALDSKTENQIKSAIADLLKGRTCIVIAHRLSTILHADQIVVMEKGSIVEEGKHHTLIKQDGVYAELWGHQTDGYISA